jgi:hypothetical protein
VEQDSARILNFDNYIMALILFVRLHSVRQRCFLNWATLSILSFPNNLTIRRHPTCLTTCVPLGKPAGDPLLSLSTHRTTLNLVSGIVHPVCLFVYLVSFIQYVYSCIWYCAPSIFLGCSPLQARKIARLIF